MAHLQNRLDFAVQTLLRLNAAGALDYLYLETGKAHYLCLRTMQQKDCTNCTNPLCSLSGHGRVFREVGAAYYRLKVVE